QSCICPPPIPRGMRKQVVILGPPEQWAPLLRDHRQLIDITFAQPLRAVPRDDSVFSLFLVDLLSGRYSMLIATCPMAIEAAVAMARKRRMLDRLREAVVRTELVVIGERTAQGAARNGLTVSSIAPEATTDALIEHVNRSPHRGAVALLRSDQGSERMVRGLQAAGWEVEDVPVYTLLLDEGEGMQALLDRIEDGEVDALVLPTPAHAQAFMLQLQERCGDDAPRMLEGITIAAMGRETEEWLEAFGVKVDVRPERAEAKMLLSALTDRLGV
ncbi:MAG TPA: uroporphyrinogen-III synthase, partial [Methanomassiliicoccales archaeon]|nr:uroporphyrinogen-III synthase [Methanomassiliicoccales archaeon]